ncbi:hypothetical protein MESS2_540015 [Mesorhizobium metallidurans STM 2683]|uniref:Transposase IS4-like domain-containing protein n=1 Tax=Mesorhizobium metallidurans STM 2683 TaxID=1297569 RepID=M5EU05_9HYPH|nr:hypothetical protein MESS2_540015 [Mesorhizobium metallidurans STM 2683]
MLDRRPSRRRITLGADKAYDVRQFVKDLRERKVTPHIAVDGHLSKTGKPRVTAIDDRTKRHPGYDVSQRCRKRIEEVFGWIKASAGMAKVKLRGCARVGAAFTLNLRPTIWSACPSCWRRRYERHRPLADRRDARPCRGLSRHDGARLH